MHTSVPLSHSLSIKCAIFLTFRLVPFFLPYTILLRMNRCIPQQEKVQMSVAMGVEISKVIAVQAQEIRQSAFEGGWTLIVTLPGMETV